MPRSTRIFSKSGYMHLIIRGIGKQLLFEHREDYQFFLFLLKRFCYETQITVLAYCLMENHVHLLVCDNKGNTSIMMHKLEMTYASYFNKKYERTGHLFQNRFMNVNLETEGSLLNVFRYILNNPAKAGICPAASYEWSSYRLYGIESAFVDVSVFQELIGSKENVDIFLKSTECSDYTGIHFVRDDEWAKNVIREKYNVKSGTALQDFRKVDRDTALHQLKKEGLSVRQIERLTGISKSVVQRA